MIFLVWNKNNSGKEKGERRKRGSEKRKKERKKEECARERERYNSSQQCPHIGKVLGSLPIHSLLSKHDE